MWASWATYLSGVSIDEFTTFIKRFEWITGRPDPKRYALEIRDRLYSMGSARDPIEAQAVHDALFVFVARLLGTPGEKRLTVTERTGLLAAPTLPTADRALLTYLREMAADHENRLGRLEADVTALSAQVDITYLAGAERVEFELLVPDLSVPPPAPRLSPVSGWSMNW